MDLTTRCPECGTTFSASMEQLQLRKGYIRCVNCAHIFDGYDAVVSAGDKPAAAPTAPVQPIEPSVSMPSVLRQRPVDADEPVHTMTPVHTPPSSRFTISGGAQVVQPGQDPVFHVGADGIRVRPDPVIKAGRHATTAAEPSLSPSNEPRSQIYVEPRRTGLPGDAERRRTSEFLDEEHRAGSGLMQMFWRGLVVAGIVLLLGQLVYVYRAQIANQVPALRPLIEQGCVALDCKVPYARQIDQISIMSSSLRSGRGAVVGEGAPASVSPAPDTMLLQLTLRNNADKPQEWPTLVLDLTDSSGTLIVRKNLSPQTYLPTQMQQQPFQANTEITISVPVVLNGIQVNGYQLDKFFQ